MEFSVKGYDNSEHLRRDSGLYHHLCDLYNKGTLTTWEMNIVDKVFSCYLAEDIKNLEKRGLIDHTV